MGIKCYFTAVSIIVFNGCLFHDNCYRSIEGTIKNTLQGSNLYVRVCRDYGSGYDSNCDLGIIDSTGTYKLSNLPIAAQNECNNDCENNNPTLPIRIGVKIYKTTEKGDTILKEVNFSCKKDFSFSGKDIQLPIIEMQ